jgi:hypothetical protein
MHGRSLETRCVHLKKIAPSSIAREGQFIARLMHFDSHNSTLGKKETIPVFLFSRKNRDSFTRKRRREKLRSRGIIFVGKKHPKRTMVRAPRDCTARSQRLRCAIMGRNTPMTMREYSTDSMWSGKSFILCK